MQINNRQHLFKATAEFRYRSPITRFTCTTLIALCCMLLTPLPTLACGGLFTSNTPVDQSIERIIFTVDPGSISVYEQINYTGTASDFAWVLPVPAVPTLATAPVDLFRTLDTQTVPTFFYASPPPCGLAPLGGEPSTGGAPAPVSTVNVYNAGTVGPYAFDVIGSNDPNALTHWLQNHQYHIPGSMQSLIQTYTQAHMLFLAMRLQPQKGIQDITPVKITFPTTQSQVMIPLRMAAAAANPHMGLLVWIFGSSRFVPQNYQSVQFRDEQLSNISYEQLIDNVVNQANGHAFVTEYAQPTNNLYNSSDSPTFNDLRQHYRYVTRLYTRISPEQMTVDPIFAAQSGLPDVSRTHIIPTQSTCDPFNLWLGSLGRAVYLLAGGIVIVLIAIVVGGIILARRRKTAS